MLVHNQCLRTMMKVRVQENKFGSLGRRQSKALDKVVPDICSQMSDLNFS